MKTLRISLATLTLALLLVLAVPVGAEECWSLTPACEVCETVETRCITDGICLQLTKYSVTCDFAPALDAPRGKPEHQPRVSVRPASSTNPPPASIARSTR